MSVCVCVCLYVDCFSRYEFMFSPPDSRFILPTVPSKAVRLENAMEPLSDVVETGIAGSYPAQ